MTDWYRLLSTRLANIAVGAAAEREAVYARLHSEASDDERARLEVVIRRLEQHALLDPPVPAAPDRTAYSDDLYELIAFRDRSTGAQHRGVVGWRTGPRCWVTLQVHDGPQADASALDLASALAEARRRLARKGFEPFRLPTAFDETSVGAGSPFTLLSAVRPLLRLIWQR